MDSTKPTHHVYIEMLNIRFHVFLRFQHLPQSVIPSHLKNLKNPKISKNFPKIENCPFDTKFCQKIRDFRANEILKK